MKKVVKVPSPFLLEAYAQFLNETGKEEVKLGEFLTWIYERNEGSKGGEKDESG